MLRGILRLIFLLYASAAVADSSAADIRKIQLDEDLIWFFEHAVYAGGAFLVVLAGIGVTFFGFDVRKARQAIDDEMSRFLETIEKTKSLSDGIEKSRYEQERSLRELQELKQNFEKFVKESQEKFEELVQNSEEIIISLGTRVEDVADKATQANGSTTSRPTGRTNEDLIRDIVQNSSFKWRSIDAIMKRTGLSREDVLKTARAMPDIIISRGNKSHDYIFGIKS